MTLQKGICAECGAEYEYEYNPKYPRKYCDPCRAVKKAEFENRQKVPVVKPGVQVDPKGTIYEKPSNKNTTMYVSYAKDIFLGLLESDNSTDREVLMTNAISRVKQAQKEFS